MGRKKLVRKAEPQKPLPEKGARLEQQPKSRWRPALRGAMRVFAALIAVGTLLIVFRGYIRTLLYIPGPVVGTVTAVAAIVVPIVVLIRVGQRYEWTGFGESSHPKSDSQEIQPRKTLWDWLQLLIVPLALALIVVVWSTAQEGARQQEIEARRAEAQQQLVEQQAQDEALQAYLDVMKELLLEQDLRDSGPNSNARAVANVQTSLILDRVDARRKTAVLRLLTDSQLIDADAPLIETSTLALQGADARGMDLSDTDLSRANLEGANPEGANLSGADLSGADLSGADLRDAYLHNTVLRDAFLSGANLSDANLFRANLWEAKLSQANLSGANLSRANLGEANLSRADLHEADLREANLSEALLLDTNLNGANLGGADLSEAKGVTNEQLRAARFPEGGATMPNGQKYEDWLKDKKAQGKDEKNE